MIHGKERHLHGRKQCLECLPFRPRRSPSFVASRPVEQKRCDRCGKPFAAKQIVNGKMRSLYRRRFCLDCSPFGAHNTSKCPPGALTADELVAHRQKRRRAKFYRYQKKRRKQLKHRLVEGRGGRCETCGYSAAPAALDFHHRDPRTKDFSISSFQGSWDRLLAESQKCDLLCANCHRIRHAAEDVNAKGGPVVGFRRASKVRAVAHMGGTCAGCGRDGVPAIFEFHHRDATQKDFGIGQDGIPRRWEKVVAELARCVMLCANCHREVHPGVRDLDHHEGLLGLAEDAMPYAA